MSIKDDIGEESYARLRSIIGASFPDTVTVTDDMVDEFIQSMWRSYTPELAKLGVPPPGPTSFAEDMPINFSEDMPAFPLYIAHARHTRSLAMGSRDKMQSDFIGRLPLVRVGLPPSIQRGKEEVIHTQIGDVLLSADHLVGSLEMITEKYGDAAHLGYAPERVDLITPARLSGARFGAIALYLGYRGLRDPAPSFYLMEAGTATGLAKVLFFGETMHTVIEQTSWYKPTPFASPKNRYRGWIEMDGSEPKKMVIEDSEPGQPKPYVNTTVDYERVTSISPPWPGDLTLEAAQRVAAIAEAMGVSSDVPMQAIMAIAGRSRGWLHAPSAPVKAST